MTLASGTIFLAGLATFASPCVLPVIPIYLSVLLGGSIRTTAGDRRGRLRLFTNGFMFVMGFTLVFVALGLTATAVGRFFLEHRLLFQQIGGLVVFLFGLKFLGWLRIEALEREKRFHVAAGESLSPWGALVMGVTFGFGWTPCIGPVLGAVLTFTAVSADSLGEGAWNLFLYAAGIGLPLLVVALLAQSGVRLLDRVKRFLPRIEKATGAVLIAMAVLMVTDSTSLLTFGVGDEASAGLGQDVAAKAVPTEGERLSAALAAASGDARLDAGAPASEEAADETCSGGGTACAIAAADDPVFSPHVSTGTDPASLPVDGPTVVYFWQPSCPSCLKMAPIIRSMTSTCAGEGLAVTKIDVSQRANRGAVTQFGVRGTPTLVFRDGQGREVSRLVGAADLDAVHEAMAVLMGQACAGFTPM